MWRDFCSVGGCDHEYTSTRYTYKYFFFCLVYVLLLYIRVRTGAQVRVVTFFTFQLEYYLLIINIIPKHRVVPSAPFSTSPAHNCTCLFVFLLFSIYEHNNHLSFSSSTREHAFILDARPGSVSQHSHGSSIFVEFCYSGVRSINYLWLFHFQ